MVDSLNDIAWTLRHNNPDLSMKNAENALRHAESIEYKSGIGWSHRNISVAHFVQGNYVDALSHALESAKIFEPLDDSEGLAAADINIGLVYWQTRDFDTALEYFTQALDRNPPEELSAVASGNIGLLYAEMEKFDLALPYMHKALDVFRRRKDTLGISTQYNNIGWVYQLKKEYSTALTWYRNCLALREDMGDTRRLSSILLSIGGVLREMGRHDEAVKHLLRSISLSEDIGAKKQLEEAFEELSMTYADLGNFRSAYEYHTRYSAMKDSVLNESTALELTKKEAAFRIEKHEQEMLLLKKSNELQQIIMIAVSGGLLLFVIFSIVVFLGYREKSRVNRKLHEMQEQLIVNEKLASLGQITARIAHELKNPLNFINNFAQVSLELIEEMREEQSDSSDPAILIHDVEQAIEKIHEHGNRATGIIKSMMMHARSSSEERQVTDINSLLTDAVQLSTHGVHTDSTICKPDVELKLESTLPVINSVPQDVSRAFLNIINNAVDAVCERVSMEDSSTYTPLVRISTRFRNGMVEIRIWDNGIGIPDDIRKSIFEPFFTTKPPGRGTGLGLSICYDIIVKKHGGELRLESEKGKFTEFIISFRPA